jgi:hypothetical protein
MDAPGHFGPSAWKVDQIPAENLVAPLAVLDISDKASVDPNATVEIADVIAYERRHGRIPDGAFAISRLLIPCCTAWTTRHSPGVRMSSCGGRPRRDFVAIHASYFGRVRFSLPLPQTCAIVGSAGPVAPRRREWIIAGLPRNRSREHP